MFIFSISRRIRDFFRITITGLLKKRQELNMDHVDADVEKEESRVERWYYDNGNIKAECYYVKHKLEGISVYYYDDGNVQAKEFYKDGFLDGLTKRYYRDGKILAEEYYNHGKMYAKREYDHSGNITKKFGTHKD